MYKQYSNLYLDGEKNFKTTNTSRRISWKQRYLERYNFYVFYIVVSLNYF